MLKGQFNLIVGSFKQLEQIKAEGRSFVSAWSCLRLEREQICQYYTRGFTTFVLTRVHYTRAKHSPEDLEEKSLNKVNFICRDSLKTEKTTGKRIKGLLKRNVLLFFIAWINKRRVIFAETEP